MRKPRRTTGCGCDKLDGLWPRAEDCGGRSSWVGLKALATEGQETRRQMRQEDPGGGGTLCRHERLLAGVRGAGEAVLTSLFLPAFTGPQISASMRPLNTGLPHVGIEISKFPFG